MMRIITGARLIVILKARTLVSTAFVVAGRGSTSRGVCVLRTAMGSSRRTGTSTSGSGVPSEFCFLFFGEVMKMRKYLALMSVLPSLLLASFVFSQERKPLSVEDIEELLRSGVSSRRVAELVGERGVNFEMTAEKRNRLASVGVDAEVTSAVEKATEAYAKGRSEEKKSVENRHKLEMAEVRKILEDAAQTATTIKDSRFRASVLFNAVLWQVQVEDLTGALKTAAIIDEGYQKAFSLTRIAVAQNKTGNKTGALVSLQLGLQAAFAMKQDSLKVSALGKIAATQAEIGDRSAAERTFQQALETVAFFKDDVSGRSSRAMALQHVATARAEAGDVPEALKIAESINNDSFRAQALRSIAGAQTKAGDTNGALKTVSTIKTDPWRSMTLEQIARDQAQGGNIKRALEITATIEDNQWKAIALYQIAAAQVNARDVAGAIHTAAAIQDDRWKGSALRTVASAQARAGDLAGALQTAATIKHDSSKAQTLGGIAEALGKAGDRAAAATTFQLALQAATEIKNDSDKASTLGKIAASQAKAGDHASATTTFQLALQATTTINQESTKGFAMSNIAQAQAEAGDIKGALAWSMNQTSPLLKANVLLGVATGALHRIRAEKRQAGTPKE